MKVGFVLSGGATGLLGNRNYYRNLLVAIQSLTNAAIEPVIFTGTGGTNALKDLIASDIVEASMLSSDGLASKLRGKIATMAPRDLLLERLLKRHGISVLSHSNLITSIPTVGWIPDFQHLHLPHFFSEAECRYRDREAMKLSEHSKKIIVSSESAKRDLEDFAPQYADKAEVLQFVASPPTGSNLPDELSQLEHKYKFKGSYFLLPNQFWAHKNHRIVIEALKLLQERKTPVVVLVTGSTDDYRSPGFFNELMQYVKECDLLHSFRVLGAIPFEDLGALMRNTVAFINPSRFEGWSTTVEEAKSLGKTILLSDIPVHREQAPDRGVYFSLDEPAALADYLWTTWQIYDLATDIKMREEAGRTFHKRQQVFAGRYQDIILRARATS